jgi:hypothetical protein
MAPAEPIVVAAFIFAVAVPLTAQEPKPKSTLSDDEVASIIRSAPHSLSDDLICVGNHSSGNFDVCLDGPANRIRLLVWDARRNYNTLTPDDVDQDTRSSTWRVSARAGKPEFIAGSWSVTPPARDIAIQPRGDAGNDVVRVSNLKLDEKSWTNVFGTKFEGQDASGTLDPATLPAGDIDIIVLTSQGECRYSLPNKDRARIR